MNSREKKLVKTERKIKKYSHLMADASNILKQLCRLIHKKQHNFKFISVSAFFRFVDFKVLKPPSTDVPSGFRPNENSGY